MKVSNITPIITLLLVVVILFQINSFLSKVINNFETINQNITAISTKVNNLSKTITSGGFKEKSDEISDVVVDTKNQFLKKWSK